MVKYLSAEQEMWVQIPGLGRSPVKVNGKPLHILSWEIPLTEEPGRLQSIGSQRIGHNLVNKPSLPHIYVQQGQLHSSG